MLKLSIATAAGRVSKVRPKKNLPRTAEGYMAQVRVDIYKHLVWGTFINTIEGPDVWIEFKYNNLPGLYCNIFHRVGHDQHNCNYQYKVDLFGPSLFEAPEEDEEDVKTKC
ncbi:hypothetical protein FRX31_010250 [Thalictrum thalictroides]|uniref:Uncharacterized protein n=1 Tax=Thalictrum thalictroides TaxID=46969 RepID=A0A7J6WSZ0_THATH|nr:hypothetical protein FRX31_010250 [Thalictrum thalictroides]